MSEAAIAHSSILVKDVSEQKHERRLWGAWILALVVVGSIFAYGFDYYRLSPALRPFSPKHALLRPSGTIGVNLGMLGVLLFFIIFLYPLRKRWGWLGKQGNSRHWLDYHVVLGTVAPLVIALHSSFKFGGVAGMAFWIMTAVTMSGFIGRYLYSQIPRSLNAAELSIKEIQEMELKLRWSAEEQHDEIGTDLVELYELPSADHVASVSMVTALCWMIWLDLKRSLQVSSLRFRAAGFGSWVLAWFGFIPTRKISLEIAIEAARKQASLSKRILFLSRTHESFGLWHVVHRPFSYSFALLAIFHIAVAMGMGYR
jgi:hypothetical protein